MAKNIKGSTQNLVPVREIKDGTVILDNGSLVSVILVTSINFSLKSEEEQSQTISSFASFLNLLEFPIQISIESRKLDIKPYLHLLEDRLSKQENSLIRLQTSDYISFIKSFTENVNIMEKAFFVVVSYTPAFINSKTGFKLPFLQKQENSNLEGEAFEEAKSQLEQRTNLVFSGLSRIGLKTAKLGTEEVLEVLFNKFNPGENQKPISI